MSLGNQSLNFSDPETIASLRSEANSLNKEWTGIGSLNGRNVKYLSSQEIEDVRNVQSRAKAILENLEAVDITNLPEAHATAVAASREDLQKVYEASSEILFKHRAVLLDKRASNINRMSLSDVEIIYESCVELKKDLEETKRLLGGRLPPLLSSVAAMVDDTITSTKRRIIEEKEEKHKKEFTRVGQDPKTLVESGQEKAAAAWIKLGSEHKRLEALRTVAGPLKKSPETILLNKMVISLLEDWQALHFSKNSSGEIFVTYEGKEYRFADIMSKADPTLLEFTDEQLAQYHHAQKNFKIHPDTDLPDPDRKEYQNLTLAEKEAINVYTGAGYIDMRAILSGKNEAITSFFSSPDKEASDVRMKENLLHASVCISGLKKIPDYTPSPRVDGTTPKYLFRGEGLSEKEIKERIRLVEEGGKTSVFQFMSTSHTMPMVQGDTYVLVRNVKGKSVDGLSHVESEQEVLLPPTQLRWLYHKYDPETKTHFFIAEPITAPPEKPVL